MIATITPSRCTGSVTIPPSKSMAHRAIIAAAFADGVSHITNVDFSEDILATIEGMRQLGAQITTGDDHVIVRGISDIGKADVREIFCNESGSTLRFFIPIFSLCGRPVRFTGKGRLLQRPQDVYETIFHAQGLRFEHTAEAIEIEGTLRAGTYEIDGNISSQFITGLLFALPLLPQDSLIRIRPPFESRSYIDLTLEMLEKFQIQAQFLDEMTILIKGGQRYRPCDVRIEGDFSQLAFFAVLAAIQGDLTITGISADSRQGDRQILSILEDFGATCRPLRDGFHIQKGTLHGCTIDLNNCPDLGPIVFVLAAMAEGETHIRNAGRLRIKESDRIAAMEEELRKFHVDIRSTEEEVWIHGHTSGYACEETLQGHNDHRIVMAMTVMTLVNHSVCRIEDAQAIRKSYPSFFEDVRRLQGKVELL